MTPPQVTRSRVINAGHDVHVVSYAWNNDPVGRLIQQHLADTIAGTEHHTVGEHHQNGKIPATRNGAGGRRLSRLLQVSIAGAPIDADMSPSAPPLNVIGEYTTDAQRAIQRINNNTASAALALSDISHHATAVVAAVAEGLSVITPCVIALAQRCPALTTRQLDILDLVATGATNTAIVRHQQVSLATVKRELKELFVFFDVESRVELIAVAVSRGLVAPAQMNGQGSTLSRLGR